MHHSKIATTAETGRTESDNSRHATGRVSDSLPILKRYVWASLVPEVWN